MTRRRATIQLLEAHQKKISPEYQLTIDEMLAELKQMSDEDYVKFVRRVKDSGFSSQEEYSTGVDGYSMAGVGSGGKPSILS